MEIRVSEKTHEREREGERTRSRLRRGLRFVDVLLAVWDRRESVRRPCSAGCSCIGCCGGFRAYSLPEEGTRLKAGKGGWRSILMELEVWLDRP